MNELAYLGLAMIISLLGSLVVWYRQRQPSSLESGVQQFSRGLAALQARHEGSSKNDVKGERSASGR